MSEKVLVIEDDEGAADLMLAILRKDGLDAQLSMDGKSGVEKARVLLPDLVIVDLMLPRMHGYEVIERLREDARFKGMPILVVSSKSYTQDIEGAKDAGANEFMTKPYDIDKFSAVVRRLISHSAANGDSSVNGGANPSTPA